MAYRRVFAAALGTAFVAAEVVAAQGIGNRMSQPAGRVIQGVATVGPAASRG